MATNGNVKLPPDLDLQSKTANADWKCWEAEFEDYLVSTGQDNANDKMVTAIPVESDEECLELMRRADLKRKIAADAPYCNSHVAHEVVTIHINNTSLVESAAVTAHSKLHVVDLAGANSVEKPVTRWLGHQPVVDASLDHLLLGQYLAELLRTTKNRISREPFFNQRLSVLIRYLGDSLQPSSLLRFIGHIIPDLTNLDSTLSTMRFGDHVRGLQSNQLKFKTEPQTEVMVTKLQKELEKTKQDLEVAWMMAELPSNGYTSESYTEFAEQFIEQFVRGDVDEHTLLANLQPTITLQVFRNLHVRCIEEKKELDEKLAVYNEESMESSQESSSSSNNTPTNGERAFRKNSNNKKKSVTKPPEPQAVGETTKSGIGIGPGIASNFVGPATQDMKLKKSRVPTTGKSSRQK